MDCGDRVWEKYPSMVKVAETWIGSESSLIRKMLLLSKRCLLLILLLLVSLFILSFFDTCKWDFFCVLFFPFLLFCVTSKGDFFCVLFFSFCIICSVFLGLKSVGDDDCVPAIGFFDCELPTWVLACRWRWPMYLCLGYHWVCQRRRFFSNVRPWTNAHLQIHFVGGV